MNTFEEKAEDKKPNWFQQFGIWCSGASWEILKECPSDWNKFAFNGHIIFLTASLAFLSGTYFLSFVFPETHWMVPALFGLLWGFLIFTLDRIIIVSMKKNGGIGRQLIQGGLWRIFLALFIGLVIATPLELRLFQKEISAKVELNDKVRKTQLQAEIFTKDSIQRENNKELYNSIRKKYNLDKLESDERATKTRYEELDKQRIEEAEGTGGTGKIGKGPVYREKLESFEIAKADWEKAKEELVEATQKYNEEISKIPVTDLPIHNPQETDRIVDGPEARIKALYQLSGLHWFITLLFILIECLPVITKLMTPRSSYDETLERIEYEKMIEQKEIISRKNSEINELLRRAEEAAKLRGDVFVQTQRDKLDAELSTNKTILDSVAKKQETLALMALDKWFETEKAKIEATNVKTKPVLENIRWQATNLQDAVYYTFNSSGELEYTENGKTKTGTWSYSIPDKEIEFKLPSLTKKYSLKNFTANELDLEDGSHIIHLVKV